MPSKKQLSYQMSTLGMHSEVGRGAERIGGSQQHQQPISLRPESGSPVSSHPISGTSILWRSSTVKVQPLTTSTACSVNTLVELRPMLASALSFWECEEQSKALTVYRGFTGGLKYKPSVNTCDRAACKKLIRKR